jgi:hypothetical protein
MSTDVELWVVDRVEGGVGVLVGDDGEALEVVWSILPRGTVAGVVLRVGRGGDGALEWAGAPGDEAATRERRAEAERILAELRKRDPGGDVTL